MEDTKERTDGRTNFEKKLKRIESVAFENLLA